MSIPSGAINALGSWYSLLMRSVIFTGASHRPMLCCTAGRRWSGSVRCGDDHELPSGFRPTVASCTIVFNGAPTFTVLPQMPSLRFAT